MSKERLYLFDTLGRPSARRRIAPRNKNNE